MKNERAIEELLSEMLRKQDQQTEILGQHTKLLEGQGLLMDRMLTVMESTQKEIKEVKTLIVEMNNLLTGEVLKRIEKLEETVYRKGA